MAPTSTSMCFRVKSFWGFWTLFFFVKFGNLQNYCNATNLYLKSINSGEGNS